MAGPRGEPAAVSEPVTNADRILAEVRRSGGLSDTNLRLRTGIAPHQQVNQICRRLAAQGLVVRSKGPDGTIRNYPPVAAPPRPQTPAAQIHRAPPKAVTLRSGIVGSSGATLLVIPCSARKTEGSSDSR